MNGREIKGRCLQIEIAKTKRPKYSSVRWKSPEAEESPLKTLSYN